MEAKARKAKGDLGCEIADCGLKRGTRHEAQGDLGHSASPTLGH
jgi:hypothetical protein